tara:strand:+ start:53 stop:706 length:654 start_codon:yes stop_codon:yes gene_type:complete
MLIVPILSVGQNAEYKDVFKDVDSLRDQLVESGNTKILTLTFWRNPSETYPKNDTCFDCLSGYVFWQTEDTTFCKKFNRQGSFETEYQPIRMDYGDLNFSDVFSCIESSADNLFSAQIRPAKTDLIDSTNYDIMFGDTIYMIKAFSCVDCKSTKMRLDFEGKEKKYFWQSIHFDKDSNDEYYFENLNSRIYHLYLLALMNINHYERNEFWEKEKNSR